MDTPTDSDGDDSADDTDASTNAVVATVTTLATDSNDCEVCLVAHRDPRIALVPCGHQRFCEPCANEVERQGGGCPICRTDIQMILRLFWLSRYAVYCDQWLFALNDLVIFG